MLDNLTTEQLEQELTRRRKMAEEEAKPKELAQKDWSSVISQCRDYIDNIARDGYTDEDTSQYIFEAAVVAVFGPDVWKWVNDKAR